MTNPVSAFMICSGQVQMSRTGNRAVAVIPAVAQMNANLVHNTTPISAAISASTAAP